MCIMKNAKNEFIQKVIDSKFHAKEFDISDLLEDEILNQFYTCTGPIVVMRA